MYCHHWGGNSEQQPVQEEYCHFSSEEWKVSPFRLLHAVASLTALDFHAWRLLVAEVMMVCAVQRLDLCFLSAMRL